MENEQPSKLKYIGVWILTGVTSNILHRVADLILSQTIVNNLEDLNVYFIVGAVVATLISAGVFIFIYNIFKTLNIKKVFPYVIFLGGLGTLASVVQTTKMYSYVSVDLSIFWMSSIISFLITVYVIRAYYVRTLERWH